MPRNLLFLLLLYHTVILCSIIINPVTHLKILKNFKIWRKRRMFREYAFLVRYKYELKPSSVTREGINKDIVYRSETIYDNEKDGGCSFNHNALQL